MIFHKKKEGDNVITLSPAKFAISLTQLARLWLEMNEESKHEFLCIWGIDGGTELRESLDLLADKWVNTDKKKKTIKKLLWSAIPFQERCGPFEDYF